MTGFGLRWNDEPQPSASKGEDMRSDRLARAAFITCFSAPVGHAATLSVDCDAGGSINATIAQAKPRDTVLVSGTCREPVQIPPEVTSITVDGQKKTTIVHPGGQQA